MNETNRGLNRAILLVVGLILFAAGAAAAAAALWPWVGTAWSEGLASGISWMHDAADRTRVTDDATPSWFVLAVLAVLVILVVLAVVVIARLGGGRSATVVRVDGFDGELGPITIRDGLASDAITRSLSRREEVLASRVTARRVGGSDVLHVSVTPRQSTSPREVAVTTGRLVDNLAVLTGTRTPTYISIHSGVRSRLAADRPRVS